ncbi:hypothetical protein KGF54_003703 [Candida jiufengensis]|uniref:uncharacterized protein n=1 Tax=Candida jiufengensis TaxID=497108 RepID=UPI002224F782|nr:uncharacterized protein KGF54_003703 [Candida jiufengensis]KAI5952836.1 hypothetical protein KGF54_003703 [Candida jiufengensis]
MENYRDNLHVLTTKYDVCVIGASDVGKTSLINRYMYGKFDENEKLENEEIYIKKQYDQNQNQIKQFIIYDSDFHEDMYLNSKKISILNASSLMLLYSINNLESFMMVEEFLNFIKTIYSSSDEEDTIPPFILVGSKSDLENERIIEYEQGEEMCKRLGGLKYFECSSKLNVGVNECFEELLELNNKLNNYNQNQDILSNEDVSKINNSEDNSSIDYEPSIYEDKTHLKPQQEQQKEILIPSTSTNIQQPRPNPIKSNSSLIRLSSNIQDYQKNLNLNSESSTLANTPISVLNQKSDSEKSSNSKRNKQYKKSGKDELIKSGCCIIT